MDYEKLRKCFEEKEAFTILLKTKLLSLGKGRSRVSMPAASYLLNANHIIMGGVIVTLADIAAPYAVLTLLNEDERLATTRAEIEFLKPAVLQDGELVAIALAGKPRATRNNKRLINVKVQIISGKTKEVKALYKGTFLILPKTILKGLVKREE